MYIYIYPFTKVGEKCSFPRTIAQGSDIRQMLFIIFIIDMQSIGETNHYDQISDCSPICTWKERCCYTYMHRFPAYTKFV